MPDALDGNKHAKAYYGIFRLTLGDEKFSGLSEVAKNEFIDEALAIDELVNKAVAEHSLNPQNIEAEIQKGLLPRLFSKVGLDTAKEIIQKVIQITRIGLSRDNF